MIFILREDGISEQPGKQDAHEKPCTIIGDCRNNGPDTVRRNLIGLIPGHSEETALPCPGLQEGTGRYAIGRIPWAGIREKPSGSDRSREIEMV